MKTVFVDTNVFLRFFTRDEAGQHKRAVALFRDAEKGRISLVTGPPVLFEIAWTLQAAYKQPNDKILSAVEATKTFSGMTSTDGPIVENAVFIARNSGQAFADAYLAALAESVGADELATFNTKHFSELSMPLHRL